MGQSERRRELERVIMNQREPYSYVVSFFSKDVYEHTLFPNTLKL